MKKLLALAAFLLASTAAQAQMTFQYGGYTINVDPDRGTVSIPGVYDNTGQKSKRAKTDQDSRKAQDPQQAKVNPQPVAPPPAPATGNQTPAAAAAPPAAPAAPIAPAAPTTTANNTPAQTGVAPPPLPPLPSASVPAQQSTAPAVTPSPAAPPLAAAVAAVPPAPAPAPAAAPAPVQRAAAPAPAGVPARDPNSPLGLWLTEEKEGKVRIEQCGTNLCGYSVDSKSNQNGEQVLINMRPGKDLRWNGRIVDPSTGSTYDSTIALSGPDRLRVQGCAFGGMFCGGQTWTRVN